jgi:signal transduction histidine kinase
MDLTAQQRIRIGFWLLTLVPLILGVLIVRNAYDLADVSRQVAARNEIIKRLEILSSELKDVEVAQREYILVGGSEPVRAINNSHEEINKTIRELREMGADPRWLALFDELIPQKFEEIQRTVDLREEVGPEAASRVLLADRGHQAMDDMRRVVRNMIAEEDQRLTARSNEQEKSFKRTLELIAAVLLLNALLLWALYILQHRETERARRINEELERRVALRTEALQRSNEDLQQFAYVASHDLREPMRMISSYTTLLQRRYSGRLDEDADTYISFIVDGVHRMNLLIQDLLEYSRAGAGKEDQLTEVHVPAVLENVLANLKITIAEAGASVTWEKLPQSVPYDEVRLAQVFQNLIANAIKYRSDRPPSVRILAAQQNAEIVFSVSDNGIGIKPEYIDRIFGIFQRLHGQEYEGTGIGLAMVKKIVERYGGRIWVESTPGAGSTFYFTIPRAAPTAIAEAKSTSTT